MQKTRSPYLDLMCPQLVFRSGLRPPGDALDGARPVSPFPRLVFASVCGRSPRRHYASCVHSRESTARRKVGMARESVARVCQLRREVEKWRRGESPGTQRVLYPNTGSKSQKDRSRRSLRAGARNISNVSGRGTGSSMHSRCPADGVRALSLCTLGRGETFPQLHTRRAGLC